MEKAIEGLEVAAIQGSWVCLEGVDQRLEGGVEQWVVVPSLEEAVEQQLDFRSMLVAEVGLAS